MGYWKENIVRNHLNMFGVSLLLGMKQKVLLPVLMGLLIVVILAPSPGAQGAGKSIYVAPGGNDNNSGTIDKPFKTIQAAVDRAWAGDTVYVHSGTYSEAVKITHSGSNANPITIKAFPGETPIIDGRAGVDCLNCGLPDGEIIDTDPKSGRGYKWGQLVGIHGHHIRFEGFIVKRSMGRGISVTNDDLRLLEITLRNNQVHDTRHAGILVAGKGVENGLIENNVVWHAGSAATWVDGRSGKIFGWPVSLMVRFSNRVVIRGNTVYENWGEGISPDFSTNVAIEDNILYDNFALQLYIHRAENVTVQRNLLYHTNNPEFRRGGDPSACIVVNNESQFQGRLITKNIDIINNIVIGCKQNFAVWGGSEGQGFDNFLVAHNTFVNAVTNDPSDPARVITFSNSDYGNFRFENNIVYQGIKTNGHEVGFAEPGVSYNHNLWYPHRPENGKGAGSGDIVSQDPQFADPLAYTLPETWSQMPSRYWFQVKSGSPVIDRGTISQPFLADTDIIIDHFFGQRDSHPDMGVHEYGSEPAGKSFIPMIVN